MFDPGIQRYVLYALLAAVLFSLSTPAAKVLLDGASPLMLAGLLYLGQGVGLLAYRLGTRYFFTAKNPACRERVLQGTEYVWLAGAVVTGGMLGPVLLFWGLSGTSASSASLLLNFEGVLTVLVAMALFHEAVGRRVWFAAFIMLVAGLLLTYDPHADWKISPNALAVVGCCLMWAFDNNMTRHISAGDPVFIAIVKGLIAGCINIGLGYATGGDFPRHWFGAMVMGFFCFGVSQVFFIYALRQLGSARAGIYFSIAPFLGAGVSILLLDEAVSKNFVAGFILMAAAVWQLSGEHHEHEHEHTNLEHSHLHGHDAHHQHVHAHTDASPHSHPHVHEEIIHAHAHTPDIHHRHTH